LIVGAVLVVVSMLLGAFLVARADRTVAVWSAARDLSAGRVLSADDVRITRVQLNTVTSAYLADTPSPAGSTVTRSITAGELLPGAAVVAATPASTRLVTVPVEQFHAPAGLAGGEVVDVYVTPRAETGRSGPASLVAERARVHAVELQGGRFGASSRSVGVVLALDPELVSRVVSGVRRGSIDLVRVPLDAR
jgi:Flp pilus assembly protein CpaB